MTSFLADLEKDVRAALPQGGDPKARPSTVQRFLEEDIVGDRGPWTIEGHEPFGGILALIDEILAKRIKDVEISILKAEQVGASITLLGLAMHLVADRGLDVGYFLPTNNFANEFGSTRLKRMIALSEYLRALMQDRDSTNRAVIKEMGSHFLYLSGLESRLGAISRPLDALLNDEVDELPADNLEWSQGRLTHSDVRLRLNFSAGYIPGGGIDQLWQHGSQHRFLYACKNRKCRTRDICLEEVFLGATNSGQIPRCVRRLQGRWRLACPECGAPLNPASGYWKATYPEKAARGIYSFRIAALAIGAIDLDGLMKRYVEKALRKRTEMAKFRSAVLAMPDGGALQPITDAVLAEMRAPYALDAHGTGRPRYAGLDTGGDLCHLYVFERAEDGRPRIVWLEEIASEQVRQLVVQRANALGVAGGVIDKKPLVTDARAIVDALGARWALIDFVEGSDLRVEEESPDEPKGSPRRELPHTRRYRCVKINRDESLDEFTSAITERADDGTFRGLVYPDKETVNRTQADLLTTFERQLKNLRKERDLDGKGRAIHRYAKAVENHFGMAGNYAHLAERITPAPLPFEFTPVPRARSTRRDGMRSVL